MISLYNWSEVWAYIYMCTPLIDLILLYSRRYPVERLLPESSRPVRVLLEGKPGSGKSTYCQKLVYDWARGENLQSFDMVIILDMNRIDNSTLEEAVYSQLSFYSGEQAFLNVPPPLPIVLSCHSQLHTFWQAGCLRSWQHTCSLIKLSNQAYTFDKCAGKSTVNNQERTPQLPTVKLWTWAFTMLFRRSNLIMTTETPAVAVWYYRSCAICDTENTTLTTI